MCMVRMYSRNSWCFAGSIICNSAVPAPTSVKLSSSIPNPIPPFGSNVTLTCVVEVNPAVDVPVTVNTALTTPDGFTTHSIAQPMMIRSTIRYYTTIAMISSFRRSDSGLYACGVHLTTTPANAYISYSNTVPDAIRVTTGKIHHKKNLETHPYI